MLIHELPDQLEYQLAVLFLFHGWSDLGLLNKRLVEVSSLLLQGLSHVVVHK